MADETHIPPPTHFEARLSELAMPIVGQGIPGYRWKEVDDFLTEELSEAAGRELRTRCKQAGGTGRGANVLVESQNKEIDLYVIFVYAPYTVAQFLRSAKEKISEAPLLRTAAVAELISGVWRVTTIIHNATDTLTSTIAPYFPLVTDENIHPVNPVSDTPREASEAPDVELGQHYEDDVLEDGAQRTSTDLQAIGDLPGRFVAYAKAAGVSVDLATATDALACTLASQFVLFAGPSGTGKSTIARLLARFLSRGNAIATIEARAGWGGPEDVFGYYSSLTKNFAHTPNTKLLVDLSDRVASALSGDDDALSSCASSVLIVEEANLSPIEGYLAPITHGLSGVGVPLVRWPLHAQVAGAQDSDKMQGIPPTAVLGPWPRVLGTINVDANSIAPARKVTARAAVILLEADLGWDAEKEALRLTERAEATSSAARANPDVAPASVRNLGDPSAARAELDPPQLSALLNEFDRLLNIMGGANRLAPSFRDTERAANYMAYFLALASSEDEDTRKVAAENAVLHTILPQLPPHVFADAIEHLGSADDLTGPGDAGMLGGGLARRVASLRAATSSVLFADSIDFWNALS